MNLDLCSTRLKIITQNFPCFPSKVVASLMYFDVFSGLYYAAVHLLATLHGIVGQGSVCHEDLVLFSTLRQLSFTVARAESRQLSTRLPS